MADSAQVVVIGGGAIGTSTAFHLAELGVSDVILVERFGLADGTTWHSGGFIGQLRDAVSIMQLIKRSAELYPQFVATDPPLDWHGVGSLRLATTQQRLTEFRALTQLAHRAGVPASVISPAEVADRAPSLNTEDLVGAVWIPTDGYLEPDTLPRALSAAAEANGVDVRLNTNVLGIETDTSGVAGVRTADGVIATRHVVIAAGYATPMLTQHLAVFTPIGVSRQQYLVTAPLPGDPLAGMPTVREPDQSQYFRTIGSSVLLGAISAKAEEMVLPERVPSTRRVLFDAVADGMDDAWAWCQHRVPALAGVEIDRLVRGPEGVTTDGELIADETPVPGAWIAAAGNGHGIAVAGGLGWYVASRVANRLLRHTTKPAVDGADFALTRFPAGYAQDTRAMLAEMQRRELAHYDQVDITQIAG